MANQLYSFTRLDGQGRRVPGSNVLRQKMPKVGKWVQDLADVCCQYPLTTTLNGAVTPNAANATFRLRCDGVIVATLASGNASTDLASSIVIANNKFSAYGVFTAGASDTANLKLKDDVINALCPGGVVTFTIS